MCLTQLNAGNTKLNARATGLNRHVTWLKFAVIIIERGEMLIFPRSMLSERDFLIIRPSAPVAAKLATRITDLKTTFTSGRQWGAGAEGFVQRLRPRAVSRLPLGVLLLGSQRRRCSPPQLFSP
jgi:hypothetical protein